MKPITRRRLVDRMIVEKLMLGQGVEKTALQCKVGKRRIREAREKAIAHGYLDASGRAPGPTAMPLAPLPIFADPQDGRALRGSLHDETLSGKLDWIKERLIAGWSPITVFEELNDPEIGRSSFYRFLDRHSIHDLGKHHRAPSLIPPIVHEPGEALILDWGKVRDVVDPQTGEKRTLWGFVGVLGHSRYMTVRLVWTNDVATTCESIESMLREIGGVPRRITSDNPKCFATQADYHEPILNPAFSRFASHHQFVMECLPPKDPKKKGKVERMISFVRRLFEAYPDAFVSLEHAQQYMNQKVSIANERRHGTTCQKPIDAFLAREAEKLKPLPALAYEREEVTYPTVRQDGYIRFANKYYAVADRFIGKEAIAIGTAKQVSIYCGAELLEVYDRIAAQSSQTHDTKDHLKKSSQKQEEQNRGYIEVARRIGPNAETFVRAVLDRGNGFVDTRVIWGLLSLDKNPTYPRTAIEQAAGIALEMNTLSSRLVERLIKLTLVPKDPERGDAAAEARAQSPIQNKFVRPVSVYKKQAGGSG